MIKKLFGVAIAGAALIAPAAPAGAAPAVDWQRAGDGITSGISGIVVDGREGDAVDTLAVRDNKNPGENRLVAVRYVPDAKPQVKPLEWSGELPVDLEAIDAVPGRDHEYVALASRGTAYRIHVEKGTAKVVSTFPLPGVSSDGNYEGFALTATKDGIAAVWADRGQDDRPAKLTTATWDRDTNSFGKRDSAEFRAPYPDQDVRHISDVKISAAGDLTVSSASDPGDDGPYDSALYDAGHLSVGKGGDAHLDASDKPHRLGTFSGHKIEALVCLPGSRAGILGTDDENDGGSVAAAAFCRP
ncbi:hypothetical protein AB0D04_21965 [Streptomyces sp. NPDC048483]|uniref:hypothetical protein n=1 Tax=Streptomyces sp. NPDC048483 TaxID=3154927 RepID=UPI00342DFFCC